VRSGRRSSATTRLSDRRAERSPGADDALGEERDRGREDHDRDRGDGPRRRRPFSSREALGGAIEDGLEQGHGGVVVHARAEDGNSTPNGSREGPSADARRRRGVGRRRVEWRPIAREPRGSGLACEPADRVTTPTWIRHTSDRRVSGWLAGPACAYREGEP
jgi:hypothetical protein